VKGRNVGVKQDMLPGDKHRALKTQEVLDRLKINRATFERLRENDDHFIVYRAGRVLRMDERDLEAWVKRQKEVEQAQLGKDLSTIA
jgi:Fe2+ or Zn2+ uptake regulation protein